MQLQITAVGSNYSADVNKKPFIFVSLHTKNIKMKIENQIIPLKLELEKIIETFKDSIDIQAENIKELMTLTSDFNKNWVGAWGGRNYNHYNNFLSKNGGVISINADDIYKYLSKKSETNLTDIRENVSALLKIHTDFQEKIITELSVIKEIENLETESELIDKIEKQTWSISTSDYIKMNRPKSIITYNPAEILNKGLDNPPHLIVGGDLMSLFSILSSIEDFQKNTKRLFRQLELKLSIEEYSPEKSDFIIKVIEKFHTVARQILNRHAGRTTIEISDEYDVQDLFHGLLRIEFEDVRAEEYTPSYAGSATRMDFLLKKEKIVIEVKKTRNSLKDKEIGDQLIIDVQHYKIHPDCKRLICFVYDPDSKIKNPRGLEVDLNSLSSEELIVEVYIRP